MICRICGSGSVKWKGPPNNLTHTECAQCGGINCQRPDGSEQEWVCVICGAEDTPPIARGDGTYDHPICDDCYEEHYELSPNSGLACATTTH